MESQTVSQPRSAGRWLSLRLRALRAFSFPVSVLPVVVAAAVAAPVGQWRWDVLVASVLGAMLSHAGGNLLNDYFDFRQGVDRKTDGDEGRPGRLLVRGEMLPPQVLAEALGLLAVDAAIVIYLFWRCGPMLPVFAAAAGFALYAYTGPPFRLKYCAMGEPLIFLIFGPMLMTGAAYAQTGRLEPLAMLLSLPVGFATTAVLVGNNIRDLHEDQSSGIRTLTHVIGPHAAAGLYVALVVNCVLGIGLLGVLGILPRVLAVAPLALVLLRQPLGHVVQGRRLADIDAQTARFEAAVLAFVLGGLLLAA